MPLSHLNEQTLVHHLNQVPNQFLGAPSQLPPH
jgi:hypothetical protein